MSRYGNFNEDDDDFDNEVNESNLVKDLRKQLREAHKERDELATQVASLSTQTRAAQLKEVFESKKLSPKLAKFFPADGEVTPEAVDAWVTENADVFGIKAQDAEEAEQESAETAAEAAVYQRMTQTSGASSNTGDPAKFQDLAARIQSAGSLEELQAILAGQ